jgi:hypothetical protein
MPPRIIAILRRRDPSNWQWYASQIAARDDDLRYCIECAELRKDWTCAAAARGVMPGARIYPVLRNMAQRCPWFKEQE